MPIYYRSERAVITHKSVEVPRPSRRRFAIGELDDIHVVVDELGPVASAPRLTSVSALVAAAAAVRVVAPAEVAAAVALLVGVAVYTLVARRRRRTRCRWRMRATYRGRKVEIFSSEDRREFAEFQRGLVRSLEYRDS
jgi:hypothetical protein